MSQLKVLCFGHKMNEKGNFEMTNFFSDQAEKRVGKEKENKIGGLTNVAH